MVEKANPWPLRQPRRNDRRRGSEMHAITPSRRMSPRQFILAVIGMSLRQVILAFIVGLVLAALILWLAPELVLR